MSMKRWIGFFACIFFFSFWTNAQPSSGVRSFTNINKPWTRWWWMGSAVDEPGIKKQLQQLFDAGFGGVEIVPIYGAKGFENRYIKYLSPQWMKMLDFTVQEAKKHDMGVYVSVGTGWPIGGSHVTIEDAASKLIVQKYTLKAGTALQEKIVVKDPKQVGFATVGALMFFPVTGAPVNVIGQLDNEGRLNYISKQDGELIATFTGKTRQAVKRAAPGGEGYTIDHFSKVATVDYFKLFDTAFGNSSHGVDAFFNDSYEVYNADWTPDFYGEFQKRRGYDLRNYLNLFTSNAINDSVARIKSDYRETISDLMLENFSTVFTNWTHTRKTKSVNQAHGSPGNLLDLYGAFDIPECETYGSSAFGVRGLRRDPADIRNVDPDPVMLKFASSAAHEKSKTLTSCETFTWLGEHFKTSCSQCKPEVDQAFLSGINHVFYHGTTYTPADVKFPGWLFYASVNFVPYNSLWKHLKGLNEYIARCQQVLQAGQSSNSTIKMYWPVYDAWHNAKGMDMPFKVHDIDEWLHPTAFYKDVKLLQEKGFEVDFLSDRMIEERAKLSSKYKKMREVIVIPKADHMSMETLKNSMKLATNDIVIFEELPTDVNGWNDLEKRRSDFSAFKNSLVLKNVREGVAQLVNTQVYLSSNILDALDYLNQVQKEPLTVLGLKFIKRVDGSTTYYFVSNNTGRDIDEQVELNVRAGSITFINPLNGDKGSVKFESKSNGEIGEKVRLQLKSGQSLIIEVQNFIPHAYTNMWKYIEPVGSPIVLDKNKWTLQFKEGGPVLPKTKTFNGIRPWTTFTEDNATQSFSGTAVYTTQIAISNKANDYLLRLDSLYESARIIVNGKDAGIIWSLPFELKIGQYLKNGTNTIQIEVCNLMANRMRDMDKKKELWRNYNEINFVNINYKDFDASGWPVMPSGLGGGVQLVPLK